MNFLNRVTLIGNLADDPVVRSTKTGKKVCNFPIAVNRAVKAEDGGRGEATDFHRIIAWEKLGETVARYLKKGRRIMIEGKLANGTYEDKEGKKRYTTDIVLETFYFMDSKTKGEVVTAGAEA